MISLKDMEELDDYIYKVCEVSDCDEIAECLYESDDKSVNVCYNHYKELSGTQYIA